MEEDPIRERSGQDRRSPATIYDIATLVGVSPSTVSRALNKPGRINVNTEQRIRDAAVQLGYRSNPMARALPTGRTGTVGLLLSDITNPVYFDLIRGAQRVTASRGQTLVLAESQESAEQELDAARSLQPATDGLVLVGSRLRDDEIRGLAEFKPVILVNRRVDGIPSVVADNGPGLEDAVAHLAMLGHRVIAYLSGPPTSWMNAWRSRALFEMAVREGLSIVEIGPGAPTVEGGAAMRDRVRASGVTAVIAYNDLMAFGMLRACRAAAVDVPGELSVVGFDDIFGADLTTPTLTTIRSPLGALGEVAVQLISGDDSIPLPAPPPVTFILRESTSPPRVAP